MKKAKKFKLPSAEKTKERLTKLGKASKRKAMVAEGLYDGRFRTKTIVDPKFKKPKHKKSIFEKFDDIFKD